MVNYAIFGSAKGVEATTRYAQEESTTPSFQDRYTVIDSQLL